ncbi:MAG: glycosyltransferase family 87 protein, partial [Planctomycetota bacterium]
MTRAPAPFTAGHAAAPELPAWLDWLAPWLGWLFALGIGSLVLTIVLVPVVVVRLPADHFVPTLAARPARNALGWLGHFAKNALGVVLALAGIAMLVLPGQGILTLLVGLLLVDFPGKRRLELALVRRPPVRAFLDRIRTGRGCEPFRLDPATPARGGSAPTPVLRHALTAALVLAVAAYFWLRWPSWQALSAAIDYMPLQQDFVGHYHPMGRQLLREPVPVPGYFYPSFFALLLVPFGQLDVDTASLLWGALQLALVLALGWLVLRAGLPRTVTGAALALCLVSTSAPVLHNLKWGQVSVLLTLCALVALWPRPHERQRLRGAVLGFATAVKVYPGLFAVLWLARRNVRALVAFVATAALCTVVIPALVLGPAGWWRFERAVVSAIRSIDVAANLNSQSFANVVARWDYLCTGAATGASAHFVLRVVGALLGIAGLVLAAGLDRR